MPAQLDASQRPGPLLAMSLTTVSWCDGQLSHEGLGRVHFTLPVKGKRYEMVLRIYYTRARVLGCKRMIRSGAETEGYTVITPAAGWQSYL